MLFSVCAVTAGRLPESDLIGLYRVNGVWKCIIYELKHEKETADQALDQVRLKKYVQRAVAYVYKKHNIILKVDNITCFGVAMKNGVVEIALKEGKDCL
jgi:hypothetical protein